MTLSGMASEEMPAAEVSWSADDPIRCVVEKVDIHTKTMQYRPLGDQQFWQIGQPYVPCVLFPNESRRRIHVGVQWDRDAGLWDDSISLRNGAGSHLTSKPSSTTMAATRTGILAGARGRRSGGKGHGRGVQPG